MSIMTPIQETMINIGSAIVDAAIAEQETKNIIKIAKEFEKNTTEILKLCNKFKI